MSIDSRALAILEDALELDDPSAREAMIAACCAGDAALEARVRHLLSLEGTRSPLLQTESFSVAFGLTDVIAERIGPFRVTGEIARGGMGAVVKAQRDDGLFEQTVAIKIIRADIASPRSLTRFAEERRILARLRHPGIVRILDGGEYEGRPWLAMDFIDGLPINKALDGAGAGREARLDAFLAVCEAVAHAHRMLVIHADIKPGNILMDAAAGVHLLDFGISQLVADLGAAAEGDPYPLTRGYAAPERRAGVPPTIAGDVFSLGMLMVEVLTGAPPDADRPCADGTLLPTGALDGDLARIAARALAVDPARRYPDVTTLIEDLRRYRGHLPVQAGDDANWPYHARLFARRHRKGLAVASAFGLLLAGTAVTTSVLYWRAEDARKEADARFADARGAARYMIYDLMPRLEMQPRSLALRVRTAAAAQRYLERLANSGKASDAVRIEAADGLLQLAQYQGRPGRPNLAQPDLADANLRRAEAILIPLAGEPAKALLTRVRLERLRLASWSQGDAKAAEALERSVATAFGKLAQPDPALVRQRAMVLADLRDWQGRFDEETRIAGAALASIGTGKTRHDRIDRAVLLANKASALYYSDKLAEALAVYAERRAVWRDLYRESPGDPFLRGNLIVAEWDYASTLLPLKRFAEAEALMAAAEPLAVEAVAFDPDDEEAARRLRVVRNTRAQALGFLGRTDAALGVLARVRAADEAALKRSPNARRARDLVFDHTLIGETLDAAGRKAEACSADRETLKLYDGLQAKGTLMQLDLGENVRLLRERIARNCPPTA